MQAIETKYKGYRFRSRLEARWAVFFDAMFATWEYEVEGFDLSGDWYLPDFFLFDAEGGLNPKCHPSANGIWVEIKPSPLTVKELDLLKKLAIGTGHKAVAIAGSPYPEKFAIYEQYQNGNRNIWLPGVCKWCKGTGLVETYTSVVRSFMGEDFEFLAPELSSCPCDGIAEPVEIELLRSLEMNFENDRQLLMAFSAARSARFEHGECGSGQ